MPTQAEHPLPVPKDNMPPIHPGEYLRDELEEAGLSIREVGELLDKLGVWIPGYGFTHAGPTPPHQDRPRFDRFMC